MLQNIYEFWGSRDLNNFLKGNRRLENEKSPEQLKKQDFWVVRDLNLFLKGNRKLEPIPLIEEQNISQPPFQQALPVNQQIISPQTAPPFSSNQSTAPLATNQTIPRPLIKPRIPGIRQNMSILVYGICPLIYVVLAVLRLVWAGMNLGIVLPGFILWIIAGAAYLTGAIFIVFDFNLGFYKPTIVVLAFSVLLDVAGLLCNTIQLGIYSSQSFEDCKIQTLNESEGYYYDFDYVTLQKRQFEICIKEQNPTGDYIWLIIFLLASFFIYCDYFVLVYRTYKAQPQQNPDQKYELELPPLNRNVGAQ